MSSTTFFFIFVPFLALALLLINFIFAPHNPYREKNSVFECGYHSFLGQNRTQFSISFFIFALLFLLFDLEILLVYPYIVSAYTNGVYGLYIMLMFFIALTIGLGFELGKKALNIDSRQNSSTENNSKEIITIFLGLKKWGSYLYYEVSFFWFWLTIDPRRLKLFIRIIFFCIILYTNTTSSESYARDPSKDGEASEQADPSKDSETSEQADPSRGGEASEQARIRRWLSYIPDFLPEVLEQSDSSQGGEASEQGGEASEKGGKASEKAGKASEKGGEASEKAD